MMISTSVVRGRREEIVARYLEHPEAEHGDEEYAAFQFDTWWSCVLAALCEDVALGEES